MLKFDEILPEFCDNFQIMEKIQKIMDMCNIVCQILRNFPPKHFPKSNEWFILSYHFSIHFFIRLLRCGSKDSSVSSGRFSHLVHSFWGFLACNPWSFSFVFLFFDSFSLVPSVLCFLFTVLVSSCIYIPFKKDIH